MSVGHTTPEPRSTPGRRSRRGRHARTGPQLRDLSDDYLDRRWTMDVRSFRALAGR